MYIKITILSILLAYCAYYVSLYTTFSKIRSYFLKSSPDPLTQGLLSSAKLSLYNGLDNPELYLAIMGKVFDVTKGSTHYGPGKSYNFFIGKDASRNFISGNFGSNDADDRVSDLAQSELRSLDNWVKFYQKEYKSVGKLIGRYYNENGKLTEYGKLVKKLIKQAYQSEHSQNQEKEKYPPCNVEWDAETGSRVWCTRASGGIQRDWVGVPRQMYEPEAQAYRCACIRIESANEAKFKEYEKCDKESESCYVINSI